MPSPTIDGMPFVDVAGRRLEYEEVPGSAPPLVFLHEGLGSVALWRDFPARVAAATGRRALVYSRLGHGWSDGLDRPRTARFMHEEALEVLPQVLARLEAVDPVLIGHSDGASIAIIYAGSAPPGPSALVLLSPHVFVEELSLEGIREARRAFEETDLRARMARYHRDPESTFRGWNDVWLSSEFRDWNIEGCLRDIACPVLLVQGRRDQYGTPAQLDAIERGVRGPVERLMLSCRHSPHIEEPERTLAAVRRFLCEGVRAR
jgi:pimeloyl-ACP methyl ester carboxylesterase